MWQAQHRPPCASSQPIPAAPGAHPLLSSLPGHFQSTQPCASTRDTAHGRGDMAKSCSHSSCGALPLVPSGSSSSGPSASSAHPDTHRDTPPLMHSQVVHGSCPGLMSSIGLGVNPLFGLHKFPEPVPSPSLRAWGGDRTDTSVGTSGVTNSWHLVDQIQ